MFTIIFTILVVYLLWFLVRPLITAYLRRRFQRKMTDMFTRAFGGAAGFDPRSQQRNAGSKAQESRRRKVFSRDEGEYIEFEEVSVTAEYTAETSAADASARGGYTPREPRVTDAEWIDLP